MKRIKRVFVAMPGLNEVPAGFPATTLWRFRLGSLATQLTLWTALGLIFGPLTERSAGYRRHQTLAASR